MGYIKTILPESFLSFQIFHRLLVFALRVKGLSLTSPMRLDGWTYIQSIKSAWSVLHHELKAHILPSLEGNSEGRMVKLKCFY